MPTETILQIKYSDAKHECGCDEAGRGCLAGPVTAAAVILPDDFHHPLLNDSKQLSEHQRDTLRPVIEREALTWGVAFVDEQLIDEINILNASILAMHKALERLTILPDFIIIDGNRFKKFSDIPHQTIVKGDSKYLSIAAASVLAKTHRDEYMLKLHNQFPQYDWHKNKAYPTKKHRESIRKYGITPYHRLSYNLLGEKQSAIPLRPKVGYFKEKENEGGEVSPSLQPAFGGLPLPPLRGAAPQRPEDSD
jgi:ribonuclease HII